MANRLTEAELEAIRARERAATPGPWENVPFAGDDATAGERLCLFANGEDASVLYFAEADFIAHARTDVPRLLAELDALRAELKVPAGDVTSVVCDMRAAARELCEVDLDLVRALRTESNILALCARERDEARADLARVTAERDELSSVLADLVATLPKCDECGRPATRHIFRRGDSWLACLCDVHGARWLAPEDPRAPALRRAEALLAEKE